MGAGGGLGLSALQAAAGDCGAGHWAPRPGDGRNGASRGQALPSLGEILHSPGGEATASTVQSRTERYEGDVMSAVQPWEASPAYSTACFLRIKNARAVTFVLL